jgi:hypothetical protein
MPMIGTSNQPIRTKISQKKYVKYLKIVMEPNICMEGTRRNYSPESLRTIGLKLGSKKPKEQVLKYFIFGFFRL